MSVSFMIIYLYFVDNIIKARIKSILSLVFEISLFSSSIKCKIRYKHSKNWFRTKKQFPCIIIRKMSTIWYTTSWKNPSQLTEILILCVWHLTNINFFAVACILKLMTNIKRDHTDLILHTFNWNSFSNSFAVRLQVIYCYCCLIFIFIHFICYFVYIPQSTYDICLKSKILFVASYSLYV